MKKKFIVPIENGTVIDHIKALQGRRVRNMLNLPPSEEMMFLGENLTWNMSGGPLICRNFLLRSSK